MCNQVRIDQNGHVCNQVCIDQNGHVCIQAYICRIKQSVRTDQSRKTVVYYAAAAVFATRIGIEIMINSWEVAWLRGKAHGCNQTWIDQNGHVCIQVYICRTNQSLRTDQSQKTNRYYMAAAVFAAMIVIEIMNNSWKAGNTGGKWPMYALLSVRCQIRTTTQQPCVQLSLHWLQCAHWSGSTRNSRLVDVVWPELCL